jgi:uncharacterized protein (TIGR03083 family)
MTRSLEQARAWVARGTRLCHDAISMLDEASYAEPCQLDGWTRKHLVAHLAANAEAIGRLVAWAHTGEEQRMYASPEQRRADIEAGALLPGSELTSWFERSARDLDEAMDTLSDQAWRAEVVTAQGRTVPAAGTAWMRSREVMVHAVDLGTGLRFTDLPADFLGALRADIIAKRGVDAVPDVRGGDAEVTAYLAGRPHTDVTMLDGSAPPALPPWL